MELEIGDGVFLAYYCAECWMETGDDVREGRHVFLKGSFSRASLSLLVGLYTH